MRDLPGGPVVETSPSMQVAQIRSWGAKIPRGLWPKNKNLKQWQYCNKFNKDFKNGPPKKNLKKREKQMYK